MSAGLRNLCLAWAAGVAFSAVESAPSEAELEKMFQRFQSRFPREYSTVEAPHRFLAFKRNVLRASELNREQGSNCTDLFSSDDECVFGVTKFMDIFPEEFAATHHGFRPRASRADVPVLAQEGLEAPAQAVDWRQKGAVTEVKDQGGCGSCWAFSTTQEVESQVFMKTGQLPVLSTQQIISCDKQDLGCNGGDTVTGYQYIEQAGGLDLASDYPDRSHETGETGKCTWDKKKAAKVTGFSYAVKPCQDGPCKDQDEDALAAALASKGPVSICVNADDAWQSYSRGVFSHDCSGDAGSLDHCVQLVGYNKAGPKPYWIVRNSWNTDWGIDGYMHLEMGKNLCGVADEATIAEVASEVDSIVV